MGRKENEYFFKENFSKIQMELHEGQQKRREVQMEFEIFKAGVYSMYDRQNNRIPLLYTRTTSSRGR